MHHVIRTIYLTLCLFGATVMLPSTSLAQAPTPGIGASATATDPNNQPVITTRLVASHAEVVPGQTVQIAWEFKLNPHWHIYWSNAGDSGLPPELKTATANPEALPLTFPTPKVISIPPLTNYGYEDSVTFTTTYTVPTGLAKGLNVLPFTAGFLYCNDVCMPGQADLKLPLVVSAKAVLNDTFKPGTNLPADLPARSNIMAETSGKSIQLNLPLNLAAPNVRFIPNEDGIIDDSAPQALTGNTLSIPLDPQAENAPENLSGLLLINGQSYRFSTPVHGAVQRSSTSTDQPYQASTLPMGAEASFLGALFFAFVAGLILNLMPCVLPVLSLKMLSLIKHHNGPSRKRHTIAYTLGILASFWVFAIAIAILKETGSQFGWGFHLQNPLLVAALALIMVAVAFNFFGIFELGEKLTRLGSKPGKTEHTPIGSSFATGALAVVVATPCTVPFMGGAMAYALTQSAFESLLIFTALGLGMALPFLIAIPYPKIFRWLPKPGAWMSTFRHLLGWPMLATALWLTFVLASQTVQHGTFLFLAFVLLFTFTLWLYGAKPSRMTAALPFAVAVLTVVTLHSYTQRPQNVVWQPWSVAAVEQARQTGNPVFVDFTADWCITCKVTEATVLNTDTIQKLFADTRTTIFQADWTNQNPEITAELARHNRKGVPLYLLYMPGKDAEVLPQLITPGLLKEKLQPKAEASTETTT